MSGTINFNPSTVPIKDNTSVAVQPRPVTVKSIATKTADKADDVAQVITDDASTVRASLLKTKSTATTAKAITTIQEELSPISEKLPSQFKNMTEKVATSKPITKTAEVLSKNKIAQKVVTNVVNNQALWKEAELLQKTGFIKETGTLGVLNKGIGATGIVLGGVDIYKGVKQFNKGEKYEGGYRVVQGAVGVVGGAALMTGAVVGGVAVAPVAATVGVALAVGKFGNDATKELGWFKDKDGKNETAIHHLRTVANETNDRVTKKTGSKVAGAAAASTATHLQVGVTAVAIVGAASSKGLKVAGKYTEKAGKAVHEFGNKMDKKADDLKKSNSFVAKTAGYAGAVVVAKTSKAVGVAIEKTGQFLTGAGKFTEKVTGAAVKYAEAGIEKVSNAVGNTVGAVNNGISSGWNAVKSWF